MADRVRVFISHSARDGEANAVRQAIQSALRSEVNKNRFDVLVDDITLEPGDAWRSRINLWLGACDVAIVIISPEALASRFVIFEVNVLGYRRWRHEAFPIIPVLVGGVTKEEVERSAFNPSQTAEWMWIIAANPEETAQKIVKTLENALPLKNRPIDRMATVLEPHLPQSDAFLEEAAKLLSVELPWDVPNRRGRSLSLQVLAAGMTLECAKAVRKLRKDPTFKAENLATISDLLTCAWVDLKAQAIPDQMRNTPRPAFVLNARFADTVKMYLRAAGYLADPRLDMRVAEPDTTIEERPDDPAYREAVIESVQKELLQGQNAQTKNDLDITLKEYFDLGEPVVVALPAAAVSPAIIAELQSKFEYVTFFLLAGQNASLDTIENPAIHVIHPPLLPSDEETMRSQFVAFCRRINLPL